MTNANLRVQGAAGKSTEWSVHQASVLHVALHSSFAVSPSHCDSLSSVCYLFSVCDTLLTLSYKSTGDKCYYYWAASFCPQNLCNVVRQMKRFLNLLNLPHVSGYGSIQQPFVQGSKNVKGDWTNLLSNTFKLTNLICLTGFMLSNGAMGNNSSVSAPVDGCYAPQCLKELFPKPVKSEAK